MLAEGFLIHKCKTSGDAVVKSKPVQHVVDSTSAACRAIRFGYNVMLLDADVTVFDDPYKYFKQPPFKDFNVINQPESAGAANGGILYVQVSVLDCPVLADATTAMYSTNAGSASLE